MLFFLYTNWQIGFNDPATSLMLGMVDVHHQMFFYLMMIFFLVFWLFFYALYLSVFNNKPSAWLNTLNNGVDYEHCAFMEVVWTVLPGFVLVLMAMPSLSMLYSMDENLFSDITLKVMGSQWYWSYEYPDYLDNKNYFFSFDSNLLDLPVSSSEGFSLLDVDNRVVLPMGCNMRALITSSDVLHSWSVTEFGVKVDACPGRLNQVLFSMLREGVYYGQCSELCGTGHGFMPMVMQASSLTDYLYWLNANLPEPKSNMM